MIHSMTTRLVLLYSACALITLIAITVALFLGLQKNINRDEADALTRQISELDRLLDDPVGNEAILKLAVDPPKAGGASTKATFVRVRGADGQVLYQTSGMAPKLPSSAFSAVLRDGRAARFETATGSPYLVASAHADGAGPQASRVPLIIEAATELSKDDQLVADYRRDMIFVLLFGSIFLALSGYFVTRKGLKPLSEIVVAIKRIRAEQLHDRLQPGPWPTELAALAFEFDQMLVRLEESFGRLKQFSADLAHELRTPVHAMMGQTEVVLSKPRTIEEYRSLLESNLEEQGRLARLIDDLLFLARADNAQGALVHARIDVGMELDAVVAFFDAMAQEKSISVSRAGEGLVCADRSLLRRAVSNLVSNALRHTERGGHVDLVVDRGADASTEIHVTDDGVGIATDELPRVFERFYRGSKTEQHDGGVGLGLAIVQSIMRLHGGTVDIISQPLRGTTATLHFRNVST